MATFNLTDLPDYPALRQVQEALWGVGEARGAAIMVGAGVSKSALTLSENAPEPPLWNDFASEMKRHLGDGAPTDPLKLAEEYEAALGRPALDTLIRNQVADTKWRPGPLHERLLGLPWTDVLTTNWDTLLERAEPRNLERGYEVVRTCADIARTRAPRIVKLHGSLPSNLPFIFTSEDFRTYRQKFAPFVNLAQQVLLENELCLLGFSGDDPNFLQWSGWVRDQLGKSARPIRLVGVLNLSSPRRRVLEGLGVTPIDLAPLVSDVDPARRHAVANERFIDALYSCRPKPRSAWDHTTPNMAAAEALPPLERLTAIVGAWKADRLQYPGWLVAPAAHRSQLSRDTLRDYHELTKAYEAAPPELRARFIVECIWRLTTAFEPIDAWLRRVIGEALDASPSSFTQAERADVLEALLRQARHDQDWPLFDRRAAELEALVPDGAGLAYERALRARDELDYERLAELVPEVVGDDPAWHLRRASLLAFLNDTAGAAEEVYAALRELRGRRALDRGSIWLLSREAWAAFTARAARFEIRKFRDELLDDEDRDAGRYAGARCDPWEHLNEIDHETSALALRRQKDEQVIQPQFDAGVYRDSSNTTRFVTSTAATKLIQTLRLLDHVGVPTRFGFVELTGSRVRRLIDEVRSPDEAEVRRAALYLEQYNEGLIDRYFSRVAVARLPLALAMDIAAKARRVIEYARPRLDEDRVRWTEIARTRLELLSRLVVRMSPEEAMEHLRWGLSLMRDSHWKRWWLNEPLQHHLARALEAVPPSRRHELALEAMQAPLAGERVDLEYERDWPHLASEFESNVLVRPEGDLAWTKRIGELIDYVRSANDDRAVPLLWLLHLCKAKALTVEEQARLGAVLWAGVAAKTFPPFKEIRAHAYFNLPEAEPGLVQAAFQDKIIPSLVKGKLNEAHLAALRGAVRSNGLEISTATSLAIIERVLAWRPAPEPKYDFGMVRGTNSYVEAELGPVLADALLPGLSPEEFSTEMCTKMLARLAHAETPSIGAAAAEMLRLAPDRKDEIVRAVRRGLASHVNRRVIFSIDAVFRLTLAHKASGMEIPHSLASDVVGICALRREAGLLQAMNCARRLLQADALQLDDVHRLVDCLEHLLAETDYAEWNDADPRTRAITLIRASAVQLAKALSVRGIEHEAITGWLELAPSDPAPEVRFALDEAPAT